ncbi:2-pyrone-4,6-dicarboxylate hydrolase [Rhodococcus rhodnii]|uniref:2-pyrone-4,6-dicarboxylic acid hydrolase n=2 Tax=Rhodococcus rhodnii TaxID=38312 RepID=R7WV53_9NOCA|nr:amidohydrolase family protein [Rhodococcus rhodnii]EOM78024.1 2-pyrone-4,6-dicarboxylic acid hydrolase [Rhodococcus rhodnii LMG 5362]TXG92081.1 2-pyrone-4,6-dicarboxylate hydrolase [Rhodococcus rhodnii]
MFDAHLHIIDPRYPIVENHGYLPDPFTIEDYRRRTAHLDVTGGAVVTASYQNLGQEHLTAALAELGPGWVGVAQLHPEASDDDILALDRAGVRGVRFNLRRTNTDLQALTRQALRAWDLAGWHAEFYIDATLLLSLEPVFAKLPAVSIDHLGMSTRGLPYLLDLVARGARVKATGFGRASIDDVGEVLRRIHEVDPHALMFGTDLPGSRARRVFEDSDVDIVRESIGADDIDAVLEDNARGWYRCPKAAG